MPLSYDWVKEVFRLLATGFYSGYAPWAPGTFGTLVAIPIIFIYKYLLWRNLLNSGLNEFLCVAFLCGLAVFVSHKYQKQQGGHDSEEIVIDEIAGFAVSLFLLPFTWPIVIAGFVLFRILDALKPFPISWFDKNVKGGVGVVVDDLVAGAFVNLILRIILSTTPWLS